ncbi:MAG: NYN domain-containing protein [Methylomicrobium sp.]
MPIYSSYVNNDTSYLFIDGGYLDKVIERFSNEFFNGLFLPIDYSKVSSGYKKVFYYNCLPIRRINEDETSFNTRLDSQINRFKKIQSTRGWHVQEGVLKREKKPTQKEIDVLIAVDMLTHSYRRNMNKLGFIAGDQDFRPLLKALVLDGMYVELISEEKSVSEELKLASDAFIEINLYTIHGWLENNFIENNPLPERSYVFRDSEDYGDLLENYLVPNGGTLKIFYNNENYFALHDSANNLTHIHRMKHKDINFLKKVYEYLFSKISSYQVQQI